MYGKKRVFVSDIHMNAGRFCQCDGKHPYEWLSQKEVDRFAAFLRYLNGSTNIEEVIFIGDLMDNWTYRVDELPPTFDDIIKAPINAEVVGLLKEMCARETPRVIYLPGNHDMGITKATVDKYFEGMIFGGDAKHNSVFRTSRLRAEHGSAHAMFNAPDPINNPGSRLPLGYFISRVQATREYNTGDRSRHYWTYADDLLEMLGPQRLAQSVFEGVLEEAGLPEDTPFKMSGSEENPICITAARVKEKYACLYDQWEQHYGPGVAFKAVFAEIGWLGRIADKLCKNQGTNVVVFGHSHDWELDKDSVFCEERVYANCGAWCDEDKPCTFVETQKDDQKHRRVVRVVDWNNGSPKLAKDEVVVPL